MRSLQHSWPRRSGIEPVRKLLLCRDIRGALLKSELSRLQHHSWTVFSFDTILPIGLNIDSPLDICGVQHHSLVRATMHNPRESNGLLTAPPHATWTTFLRPNSLEGSGNQQNRKYANGPMELIPVPAALLARRLRSKLGCQKQVGAGNRGR